MPNPFLEGEAPVTVEGDTNRDLHDRRLSGSTALEEGERQEFGLRHNAGSNPFDDFLRETTPTADRDGTGVDTEAASTLAQQLGSKTFTRTPVAGEPTTHPDEFQQQRLLNNYLAGATSDQERVDRLLIVAAVPGRGEEHVSINTPQVRNMIESYTFHGSPEVRQAASIALASLGRTEPLRHELRSGGRPPSEGQLQQFADIQDLGIDFDPSTPDVTDNIGQFAMSSVQDMSIPDEELRRDHPDQYAQRMEQLRNQEALLSGLVNISNDGGTHPYRASMLTQALDIHNNGAGLNQAQRDRIRHWLDEPAREASVDPNLGEELQRDVRQYYFTRMEDDPELAEDMIREFREAVDNGDLTAEWQEFITAAINNDTARTQLLNTPEALSNLHEIARQPTPEGLEGDELARYNTTRDAIQVFLAEEAKEEGGGALARRMFERYAISIREGTLDPNEVALMNRVIDDPDFVGHLTSNRTMMDRALTAIEAEVPEELEGDARDDFIARQARLQQILTEGLRTEGGSETAGLILERVNGSLATGNPSETLGQIFDDMLADDAVMARLREDPEAVADLTEILYMEAPEGLEGDELTAWQDRQRQVTERLTALMATPEGAPFANAAVDQYMERLAQGEPLPENFVARMNAMLENETIRGHVVSHALDVAGTEITDDNRALVQTTREYLLGQSLGDHSTQFTEALVDRYYDASTPGPVPEGLQETMTMMTSTPFLNPFIRANIAAYADRLDAAGEADKAESVRMLATS